MNEIRLVARNTWGSLFLGMCAVVGALLTAGEAHASVPTTYSAANCKSAGFSQTDYRDTTAQTIENRGTGTHVVYCPISKKTSGPGVTNDAISSVAMSVSVTGQVSCTLETRVTAIDSVGHSNTILPVISKARSGSATSFTITAPANAPADYWDANEAYLSSGPAWYYSYLNCSMAAGTKLGQYTVTEAGAATGYTIDPITSCSLDSDMPWAFVNGSTATDQPSAGGFIRAQAGNNAQGVPASKFNLTCKTPQMAVATVAVAAGGAAVNPTGCSVNNTTNPNWMAPGNPNATEWPSTVLPKPWGTSLNLPITPGATSEPELGHLCFECFGRHGQGHRH